MWSPAIAAAHLATPATLGLIGHVGHSGHVGHIRHSRVHHSAAELFGVRPGEVRVVRDAPRTVLDAFARGGAHILCSLPTDPTLLEAFEASASRYVDVGCDHRFEISPQAWRLGLRARTTGLAWLQSPNEPTGAVPAPERTEEAVEAGVLLVSDERYRLDPFAPVGVQPRKLTLRALDPNEPGAPATELVFGPEELVRLLPGSGSLSVDETLVARLACHGLAVRALQAEATSLGLQSSLAGGRGLWIRVPGVPSQAIAKAVPHPNVIGSQSWTWRDAVRVAPPAPLRELAERLVGFAP